MISCLGAEICGHVSAKSSSSSKSDDSCMHFLSGNTTPINVYGEIHITNTLGDGRVISEMIKPFLLKNYSGITSS